MADNDLWFLGAYLIGTLMGYWFSRSSAEEMAGRTIDHLIEQGFLKYKKDDNGEIVLLKPEDDAL